MLFENEKTHLSVKFNGKKWKFYGKIEEKKLN